MKIKDLEVNFDFLDADDVERLENATKKVAEKSEEYKGKELSMSEDIKLECKIINDFFDEVFGEGISEKLFNGKNNLKEHIKVFEDIIDEKIKYANDLNSMYERYQPKK